MQVSINPPATAARRSRWLRPGLIWFAADLIVPMHTPETANAVRATAETTTGGHR